MGMTVSPEFHPLVPVPQHPMNCLNRTRRTAPRTTNPTTAFFAAFAWIPCALILTGGRTVAEEPQTKTGEKRQFAVYFIGNSLTASTTLDRVHGLFGQRGIDLQFGSQISGGKSLLRHLNYKDEPDQKWKSWETRIPLGQTFGPDMGYHTTPADQYRFGLYDTALVGHRWDVLVMQPFQSSLHDDLEAATAFMKLALAKDASTKCYIYQTWPRRPKTAGGGEGNASNFGSAKDIDYPELWEAEYTVSAEDAGKQANFHCDSRSYFKKLVATLGGKFPDVQPPPRVIPVGEVLFALDAKIKAGTLPGLDDLAARDASKLPGLRPGTDFNKGANILYADPVHFNPMPHDSGVLGNLISGTTIFTVLSGLSPVGLSATAYGFDDTKDAALIQAVQETIWEVVTADPATGVKP